VRRGGLALWHKRVQTPATAPLFQDDFAENWSDDHILGKLWNMARNRVVSATEFKAKCLSLLDEIEQSGAAITVTRRGKPVAVLGPALKGVSKSPRDSWAGKARIVGDIVNTDLSGLWEVIREK
jgi:prevent-host-death family protein